MTYQYTLNVAGDVKELIPEFFGSGGDFMSNTSSVILGKDH